MSINRNKSVFYHHFGKEKKKKEQNLYLFENDQTIKRDKKRI